MGPALLIDGRNTAYRAVFAAKANTDFSGDSYHPFVIWMKFTIIWIEKFKPSSIHVFWDCPKNAVWRKKVLQQYKDNRDGSNAYDPEIAGLLRAIEDVSKALLPNMNAYVYSKDEQEADDLIYAACDVLSPQKTIIISSDSDMLQIPWAMQNVKCYDPRKNEFMQQPDTNPIIQKALMGDKADNIDGYRGIGEVKSKRISASPQAICEFLESSGDKEFKQNLVLIDLSLNPARLANKMYVLRTMGKPPIFDKSALDAAVMQYKVRGFTSEYPRIIAPLKSLIRPSNIQSETLCQQPM